MGYVPRGGAFEGPRIYCTSTDVRPTLKSTFNIIIYICVSGQGLISCLLIGVLHVHVYSTFNDVKGNEKYLLWSNQCGKLTKNVTICTQGAMSRGGHYTITE